MRFRHGQVAVEAAQVQSMKNMRHTSIGSCHELFGAAPRSAAQQFKGRDGMEATVQPVCERGLEKQ
jgi:hypothetical protein